MKSGDWGCLGILLTPFAIVVAIPLLAYIVSYPAGIAGSLLAMPLYNLTCGKVATSDSQSILTVPIAQDYTAFLHNQGCTVPTKTSDNPPATDYDRQSRAYTEHELAEGREVGATNDPYAGIQRSAWDDPVGYYFERFVKEPAARRFWVGVDEGAAGLVLTLAVGPIARAFYYVAYTIFLIVSAEFVRKAAESFWTAIAEKLN